MISDYPAGPIWHTFYPVAAGPAGSPIGDNKLQYIEYNRHLGYLR
jgi:hypothetical protein